MALLRMRMVVFETGLGRDIGLNLGLRNAPNSSDVILSPPIGGSK